MNELEELKEMSEEMEETQAIVEKKLRSETCALAPINPLHLFRANMPPVQCSDAKEIELLDVRTTLQNTVLAVEERDAIIEQYRLKLRNVERDLTELRQAEGMRIYRRRHFLAPFFRTSAFNDLSSFVRLQCLLP